ncbi:MAG TPA: CBS domain-containing protein [Pararhizobium sp.]|nr:CBS domain-containing protein [Pararhizobium sp.]
MNVKSILDEKGRDVVTVGAQMTLSEVVSLLTQRRIGAAVVVGEGDRVRGIISERDIMRALASKGPAALDGPAGATMTTNVMICSEEHTVIQVMEMMTKGRFRHIPVEVAGRLAGIVSIGDVVRKRIEQVEREAEEMKAYITS